jgi:hypothetical protein
MIRFVIGLIVAMGAVGGMDDPANSLLACTAVAVTGLAIMYFGAMSRSVQGV